MMKRFKAWQPYHLFILLLGVSLLAGCADGVNTGHWLPRTAPTVTSTVPAKNETGVQINRSITATFSEAMDPATITTTPAFTVRGPSGTDIAGAVTYAGLSAIFTPSSPLDYSSLYTAKITTLVKSKAGIAMAENYTWSFTTGAIGAAVDNTPPILISTFPLDNEAGLSINSKSTATFSEPMDSTTLDSPATSFTVKRSSDNSVVTGGVLYIGYTATFTPDNNLLPNTKYTSTVTAVAKDLAGNALVSGLRANPWSWTTGATPDTIHPWVTITSPVDNAINVPADNTIKATFNEAMLQATMITTNFTVRKSSDNNLLQGTVAYDVQHNTATFTPTNNLADNTLYTARITTGAKDLQGNALVDNVLLPVPNPWTFRTALETPPTVILESPADNAADVAIDRVVRAVFSEAMDNATMIPANFTVTSGSNNVSGTVAYDNSSKTATFTPSVSLADNTLYTATITTGAKDLQGTALDPLSGPVPDPWTFRTATATPTDLLGPAGKFGTFGGTAGMTNQGTLTQVVNGDIGTTQTEASGITGFHDSAGDIYTEPPLNKGAVSGKIYTCTVSTTGPTSAAVNDNSCQIATTGLEYATAAYNALAAKPSDGVLAGNLAGTTIYPGVWTGGSVLILGGNVTLDAQGDANAVFVFQIASTFTVGDAAVPRSVILIGGAQAKNVFWQVGTAATINPSGGGTMEGTIIANSGVTFSTADNADITTLNGRALSLISSVTMVNTVINVPAP